MARALILDAGLPPALADELKARGRDAYTIPGGLTDADVAALDGVVVTTDAATFRLSPVAALVPPGARGRDVVHRHAHELATLRGRRSYR